ncbi:MAG: porin [Pirellulales bacterium]
MKPTKLALAGALASLLSAGTAYAQSGWSQPSSVQQTAFEYNSYYAQDYDEKAGAKARGVEAEPDPEAKPSNGGEEEEPSFGNGCGTLLNPCCCLGEQWKLFDSECLTCRDMTIAGFLDHGFSWNPDNPLDRYNGPTTFNNRANEYNLNQAYLYGEKAVDTEGCGWDFGGRIDLLYGTDSFLTLARGWDGSRTIGAPRWRSSRLYGLAMPQAYGEVGYNKWKFKIGHFYTPAGYEVVPSTGNFFYSHALTHQYFEPFTHSGALATFTANEQLTILAGPVTGWDNWDGEPGNENWSFLGGFTVSSEDKERSLAFVLTDGLEYNINGVATNRYYDSITYSSKLSDRTTFVLEHDFGAQDDGKIGGGGAAYWYSLTGYLFYKVSDCTTYGARLGWARDQDGTRVYPVGDFRGGNVASVGGFAGNFWEITGGINYKLSANTVFRPELRWEWFDGQALNGVQPYDNGTGDFQFLAAFDIVTTF